MEVKGLTIQELLAYCTAAKEVYEYYDNNLALRQDVFGGDDELYGLVKIRNKAHDRYSFLVLKLEERLNEQFDED